MRRPGQLTSEAYYEHHDLREDRRRPGQLTSEVYYEHHDLREDRKRPGQLTSEAYYEQVLFQNVSMLGAIYIGEGAELEG
jgi:hypothetical protein